MCRVKPKLFDIIKGDAEKLYCRNGKMDMARLSPYVVSSMDCISAPSNIIILEEVR